jgi:hypothetical protein
MIRKEIRFGLVQLQLGKILERKLELGIVKLQLVNFIFLSSNLIDLKKYLEIIDFID